MATAYTVKAFTSYEDLLADRPALTEIYRPEPGETNTASVRAETRRRLLAFTGKYTHLTCRFTPNA